jgi:probable F420-dependent oxidoreductase
VQQLPDRVAAWEQDLSGAELIEAARAAEAAGLAWVSCSDHVAVPLTRAAAMGATWYDAGSTLAFVAGGTRRIRLLTHVLVLPYRHPLVVAKQFGTLDRLSGGRLILGVGSGHLKAEFATLGADFARRGQVSDEYLAAITAAWTGEVARYQGETVAFRDLLVAPPVVQRPRPPIWVGGNSRAAIRRAARYGDAWVPWQLTPDACVRALAAVREIRAAEGLSEPFEVIAPLPVPLDAAAADVRAAVARWTGAGATGFHVGLPARSLADFCARLDWLGREVILHGTATGRG